MVERSLSMWEVGGSIPPVSKLFFSKLFSKWMITQVFESGMVSLVLWCSGYHICFTRRRSPVRPWAGSDFFVTAISRTKLQVSELILDCGYYLPIVIYSAQLCLPCHITNTIEGACHQMSLLDTTQLTHMVRVSYIVPILTGAGSPVWKEILFIHAWGNFKERKKGACICFNCLLA